LISTHYLQTLSLQAALAAFELVWNCFSSRLDIVTSSLKLRAKQLFSNVSRTTLEISDFEYTILRTRLEKRNTLSDSQNQCWYYDTIDGPIGILEDDDLQNAVRYVRDRGQNSLRINVRGQDDIGISSFILSCCHLIRK